MTATVDSEARAETKCLYDSSYDKWTIVSPRVQSMRKIRNAVDACLYCSLVTYVHPFLTNVHPKLPFSSPLTGSYLAQLLRTLKNTSNYVANFAISKSIDENIKVVFIYFLCFLWVILKYSKIMDCHLFKMYSTNWKMWLLLLFISKYINQFIEICNTIPLPLSA